MCRATTERLVRRFLEATEEAAEDRPETKSAIINRLNPQATLLYLDVHRGMNNAPDRSTISFGRDVYHPVCRAYGVPVVSVRDAVWPDKVPLRPELWDTKAGAHPLWSGHQLITDLLAFAWTLAGNQSLWGVASHLLDSHESETESASILLLNESESSQNKPYLFQRAGSNELEVCPGGKYLSTPPSVAAGGLKPSRPDTKGWRHVDHNGKLGWEYSLAEASSQNLGPDLDSMFDNTPFTRRRLKSNEKKKKPKNRGQSQSDKNVSPPIPPLPPAIRNESIENLPGIISFAGRFKADDPGLLVEYLRSYANYGQAIVFVTSSHSHGRNAKSDISFAEGGIWPSYAALKVRARAMLRLAWIDHRYSSVCKRALGHENIHERGKRINFRFLT
jgi:hypothetical protein